MIAVFMMHPLVFAKDVSNNDTVLDHVCKAAQRAKLSKDVLMNWGIKKFEWF